MDHRELSIRDMVQQLTAGRPFVFVIMGYDARWDLYERIERVVEREFGFACIRADDLKSSGYDLLAKIHFLISRSDVVIAEISEPSPNVYYEIGYSVAAGKQPLLIVESGCDVPVDLKGLEVIEYTGDRAGIRHFEEELIEQLGLRMSSELALLRDMLEAPISQPNYIVASPKYPGKDSRLLGQAYDRRTFGDNLGILGLVSAFGAARGEAAGIELVSAHHSPPDLVCQPLNLYLIGSGKVNSHCGKVLPRLHAGREPVWEFGPAPGFAKKGDYPVALYRHSKGQREHVCGKLDTLEDGAQVWSEDYGIVVRGPHPDHPGRLALVMAGPHSLGTGAACLAATRSMHIKKIRSKLPEGALEDKTCSLWVLAKGTTSRDKDYLLDSDGVEIIDAGVYQ